MKTNEALATSTNPDIQTYEELFISVAKLSNHIVKDNELCKKDNTEYPNDIRKYQILSLKTLVKHLELTSNLISQKDSKSDV